MMRIQHILTVVGLSAVLVAPAHAQSVIKKTADKTHHVLQKAGKDLKETRKDAGSTAHHALKSAGNKTKEAAGDVTGIHKTGGDVGKVAHKVSHAGKKYGAKAKHSVKHAASKTHNSLTKAGKDAKAEIKKP